MPVARTTKFALQCSQSLPAAACSGGCREAFSRSKKNLARFCNNTSHRPVIGARLPPLALGLPSSLALIFQRLNAGVLATLCPLFESVFYPVASGCLIPPDEFWFTYPGVFIVGNFFMVVKKPRWFQRGLFAFQGVALGETYGGTRQWLKARGNGRKQPCCLSRLPLSKAFRPP